MEISAADFKLCQQDCSIDYTKCLISTFDQASCTQKEAGCSTDCLENGPIVQWWNPFSAAKEAWNKAKEEAEKLTHKAEEAAKKLEEEVAKEYHEGKEEAERLAREAAEEAKKLAAEAE